MPRSASRTLTAQFGPQRKCHFVHRPVSRRQAPQASTFLHPSTLNPQPCVQVIVLGIDPGTASTGYGVVKGDGLRLVSLVECGVIHTRARDPLPARLQEIFDGVTELILRHRPDALSVEDIFYSKNVRTTVVLGHARGVVLLAGQQAGVEIYELPPAEIKKAVVGTGAATKEQVQFMLTRLLRLKSVPTPSDAADGVAAALAFLMSARVPTIPGARARGRA
jgi:crossover junction endodeoxyribonuclease RuvC